MKKKKKNQWNIKYEYEYIDLVCDITKQTQHFKSFPWMTKGDQHKHKIDMQSSQVYEEKNHIDKS